MTESVCQIIRRAEDNYLQGTTRLGEYVDWSMHDTIERIDAYSNSRHISGDKDSLGRDKPFFNIVVAATNVWYRATDIDRKDIRFVPTKSSSVVLAFVANIMLQNWMNKYRFGQFLNTWGRTLAKYGSSVTKFIEVDGELIPSVIPWNRYIADPVQFDALPRIEKFYKTPAQLRNMATPGHRDYANYDMDTVEALIEGRSSRKTLDGAQKDTMSEFVEVYEVHGEMSVATYKEGKGVKPKKGDEEIFKQQMHVVSFNQSGKEYDDYTLYCGYEKQDPYMKTDLIEEDGRTLAIGAVEYLFDAQWQQNHTVKNMKDTLDLASKLVFQTADTHFVGRNVLTAIETGDVLITGKDMPLTRLANDKPDIVAMQNYGVMWQNLAQELTNTPDLTRGISQAQPLTYGLGQILNNNSNSLFEIMTENKGLSIEDMMRTYVIPHLKKQLKNTDEVVGILDDAGIQEIDSMYVPREAIRRFNKRTLNQIEQAITDPSAPLPQPFDQMKEEQSVKQEVGTLGDKRFFKPDELGKKQWDEVFSDFEWDSIRVEVTNEQTDKQANLQTLTTALQTIATNPAILQDPNAKMLFSAILNQTGVVSPIQLSTAQSQPAPIVPPQSGGPSGGLSVTQ